MLTAKVPSVDKSTPCGLLNLANVPTPSAIPTVPSPATVVTIPEANLTLRIRQPAHSITNMKSSEGAMTTP